MKRIKMLIGIIALSLLIIPCYVSGFSTTVPVANLSGDSYYPSDDNESSQQAGNIRSWYSVVWAGLYGINPSKNWKDRGKETGGHPGMDVRIITGTPLYAIADGQIVKKRTDPYTSWGNALVIKHINQADNSNYWSVYAHLNNFNTGICKYEENIPDTHSCGTVTKG